MKNFKLSCSAVALAVLITFTGCQKEDVDPDLKEAVVGTDGQELQITEVQGLGNPVITEATESTVFGVATDTRLPSERLIYILKRLNLDERQRTAVKTFVEEHEACVAEHHSKVQQIHEEVLQKANAIRKERISTYRAGKITKQELDQRLHTLHERLKEEIQKHQDRQIPLQIMHTCRAELFSKIESVLGTEQLAKWMQWKRLH